MQYMTKHEQTIITRYEIYILTRILGGTIILASAKIIRAAVAHTILGTVFEKNGVVKDKTITVMQRAQIMRYSSMTCAPS